MKIYNIKIGMARGQRGKQRRQRNAERLELLLSVTQLDINSAKVKPEQELYPVKHEQGFQSLHEACISFLSQRDKVSKFCSFSNLSFRNLSLTCVNRATCPLIHLGLSLASGSDWEGLECLLYWNQLPYSPNKHTHAGSRRTLNFF